MTVPRECVRLSETDNKATGQMNTPVSGNIERKRGRERGARAEVHAGTHTHMLFQPACTFTSVSTFALYADALAFKGIRY